MQYGQEVKAIGIAVSTSNFLKLGGGNANSITSVQKDSMVLMIYETR